MKNRIEITTDGINAYATITVKASKIGIRILSVMLIIELILLFWLTSSTKTEEIGSMIIPVLMILLLFIGLPGKYLLWNLYGKEELIVNTKSISWSYDYGFFKTNLNTINYDRLGTGYERVRGLGQNELGRLIFYNYRTKDNLPEFIHSTTILLKKGDIKEFDKEISAIFANEFLSENGFIPFSIN